MQQNAVSTELLGFLNCRLLSTVSQEEDEKQWLANRTRGIGGSDIGTICGVNNFSTRRMLYLVKTGQYEANEDETNAAKERMHFGHVLEPIVADEYFRRTGNNVVNPKATFMHREFDWCLANPDRFIIDEKGKPIGILECKTGSEFMNSEWFDGDVPTSYVYQVLWYMFVTGLRYGAIAGLIGGNKFYHYEIPYNEEIVETVLIPAAREFWFENIMQLKEPLLQGSDVDSDLAKKLYADCVKNSEISFTGDNANDLANLIFDTKKQIKELEKIEQEAENRFKDMMKENEIAYTSDRIVKWSPRSQRRVDTDKLKLLYPEIYEACLKQLNYRVFTVK